MPGRSFLSAVIIAPPECPRGNASHTSNPLPFNGFLRDPKGPGTNRCSLTATTVRCVTWRTTPSLELVPARTRLQVALTGLTEGQRFDYEAQLAEIDRQHPGDAPTVKDFVDHIDYAVNLIGVDHVGISSDFDGGGGVVGWNDVSESFNVTLELVRRGYSAAQIEKIWGGNLLRVMTDVEHIAKPS